MFHLIAVIVGALIGAAGQGLFGALVGAVLGWLLARVAQQQRELAALRARLDVGDALTTRRFANEQPGLDSPGDAQSAGVDAGRSARVPLMPPPARTEAPFDAFVAPAHDPVTPLAAQPRPESGPDTVPAGDAPPGLAGGGTAHPARPSLWEPIRHWLVGGNTIVKAGVAILFIGLAFLAKYAAEHTHLPPEVRLAGIGAVAVALLAFGWRLRLARPGYAQVLQGGAVAVLYLTLFAAFRFYGVIAATPAFVLMVAVAGLAAALAVLQDARSLAVVGALGGFATPLIVATGSDNAAALFAYYLVLDAGIAAVAWFRTWRSLNLIGFVATFVVATAWGVLRYRSESFAMSEAFLAAFFVMFVVIMVLPARLAVAAAPAGPRDAWVNSSLLFGLPTIVFALQYGLVRDTAYGTAFSALGLAAFYVLLGSWMRKRPALGITFDASLAIATIFLTLVIPFALDARSTAGAWSLEGAGLVWIGFRQRRGLPRIFGYLLLFIAGFSMLLAHDRYGAPDFVFNAYLFNGLLAAAASIAAAFFVHRRLSAGGVVNGEEAAQPLLIALATVWLVATAGVELVAFVPWRFALASVVATASAITLVYVALAARLDWPAIAWPPVAHAPFMLIAAALDAAQLANPLLDGGAMAWPLAFVVHAAVLRWAAPHWVEPARHVVHGVGALGLALLGALSGRASTADWGDAASAWPWLGWLIVPALLLFALPHPALARIWPVRDAPRAYDRSAAAVLAVLLGLWTLVANALSDGSAAPLPHVPLLNPLDIGVALALVAIALWLRRAGRAAGWPLGLLAACAFVWLNAMLVRAFHHYAGVPFHVDDWLASLAVQTGITLLWTSTALVSMWLAARRGMRVPWVVGAALLAAVVLKLILVDLSGTGTVMRIVSFIGVGVLMLVIGYVAPLPAREVRHASL